MENNNNNNNKNEQQVNIELPEDIATGIYSNLAIITHSPTEFVTDFIQMMPGMPKGKVRSRVIMTPQNTKRNLSKFMVRSRMVIFLQCLL